MELTGLALFFLTIIFLLAYRYFQNYQEDNKPKLEKSVNFLFNMPAIVTLFVLLSSLYIILSGKYEAGTQNWAFGAAGAIIGFWLKPEK